MPISGNQSAIQFRIYIPESEMHGFFKNLRIRITTKVCFILHNNEQLELYISESEMHGFFFKT